MTGRVALGLWGAFRVVAADGSRIELTSRKSMAILAMLATAPGGERTRAWLQERLWGSRGHEQAQQSLRRELTGLRKTFADFPDLLSSDRTIVRLDLASIAIDTTGRGEGAIFLEGMDIPGEDGFEEWLRERRAIEGEQGSPARAGATEIVNPAATKTTRRPILAVLPFETPEQANAAHAEEFSEDLIERLSRLRWLPVITIGPSDGAKIADADLPAIAARFGAAYLLRGRLSRRESGLSLHLRLFEGSTAQLLWSEHVALPEYPPAETADAVTAQLVATLEARIETQEQLRVLDRPIASLEVDEMLWRARWHLNRLSRDDAATARALLAEALQKRPNSAEVLIQTAFARAWDSWSGRSRRDDIVAFRALALRAIAADEFDARGYMLAGMAEMWLRNHVQAEAHFEEALRLNPSLARAYAQLGSNRYLSGRPAEALAPLQTSLRLSPVDTHVFYVMGELAISHFMLGQHAEALHYAEFSLARRPAYLFAHVMKVNALLALARAEDAAAALRQLLAAKPGFALSDLDWQPFKDASWTERLKEGLRHAGWRESEASVA